ncbi:glycoside hydrolase family 3 C-terminal domain-containing protein [Paractinoplanes globisporus]|uniref:Probable beta-glucosidase G n=1 Tax=Paractinoplanes globisporus TaxID=113565 RepID=A0ABW6WCB4_9ACTN|nr:glycoside hydrolase family 3 C-terminal domain-containing protein [Actinoplanes globisporus]
MSIPRWRSVLIGAAALLLVSIVLVAPSAHAALTLLSQGRPTTASSTENAGTPATSATDGNDGTRWASAFADPQWLQVDLGSSQAISQVSLHWETARAATFKIQVSTDGNAWTDATPVTNGVDGTQTLSLTATGRFIRMYGLTRATQYGYSLWEFQVFGGSAPTSCAAGNSAVGHPTTASSAENAGTPATSATDGNDGTRWSSAFADPQWLQVDLGSSQQICGADLRWETARAATFKIQVSTDGNAWTDATPVTNGIDGTQTVSLSATGRFIRMYGLTRATAFGYSLWEFIVHTVGGPTSSPPPTGGTGCPWVGSTAPIADRVAQVLARMTIDQKVSILHGNNNASPYIGNVTGIPALCIPGLGLQDGPAGVGDGLDGVTQMPSGTATAATFDTDYALQYGTAIGAEFAGKGANVALGPTVNIVRDPRWGRAFETYGEDPYLSGQMAAADVRGIQSQGVMASVKHAAVYNIEHPAGSVVVDERTLQEIYLPAFQTAIRDGAPASVMCAYSVVNSVPACQNPALLNTGLYQQAGFGGFVESDWSGTHSTVESANAGLTMEMPNGYFYADFLKQAVQAGTVTTQTLDTMVSRVLTQMFAFGLFDRAPSGSLGATVTTPAHVQVALRGAQEGTVLLKNTGILPLATSGLSSIAVIGVDGGAGTQTIGGGSATVRSGATVWPLTGIQNRVAGTGVTVAYDEGSNQASAVALAQRSSVAIVFASDNYGNEEHDSANLTLPNNQDALISAVVAANPRTVVVLNNNAAIAMPWLSQVPAVFEGFYDGQQWGTAIAGLLFGDINPSGKLPMTFPTSLSAVPASTAAQWPGVNGQVQYSEGLQVGYRWYDARNVTPMFPFGFGLSYTTFAFSDLHASAMTNGVATVTATVRNSGTRAGTEVAQLYVTNPASDGEPPHQLKGFQRITLAAGASATATFQLRSRDLAHWDTATHTWKTTAGAYTILLGNSSRNLPVTTTLTAPASLTVSTASSPITASSGLVNPHGMSSPVGKAISWPASAGAPGQWMATGLPPGLTMSPAGVVTGTPTARGTSTVRVTKDGTDSMTFVWTVS